MSAGRCHNGTSIGYATSAGFLLSPEAKNLADALGLTRQELLQRIARMAGLGTLT